jgi:hypothetical protein
MKHGSYYTRALRSTDPRYARVFGKLGYSRADLTAADTSPEVDAALELDRLRAEYRQVVGKRPFHGWTAAVLAEKIAAAKKKA